MWCDRKLRSGLEPGMRTDKTKVVRVLRTTVVGRLGCRRYFYNALRRSALPGDALKPVGRGTAHGQLYREQCTRVGELCEFFVAGG